MVKNFLITTWRIFTRNRVYSLINIIGLSIGMAVFLVIFNYVSFESSYDDYHLDANRVYRINNNPFASLAPSFTYLLQKEYPEIEEITRIFRVGEGNIQIGEEVFTEDNILFAEKNLFDVFQITLISGNPDLALAEPGKLILSESTAKKLFKSSNPVGKQLMLDNEYLFQVAGIFKDSPANTHLHMNMIISYESLRGLQGEGAEDYFWGTTNYSDNVTFTYVKLTSGANPERLQAGFSAMIDRHLDQRENKNEGRPPSDYFHLEMTKLTDIHLHSDKLAEAEVNGNFMYVRIFSIVGFFILLIACINFINLNTARASSRANEIGLKKIIGARRSALIGQLVMETFFYMLVSSFIAILLIVVIEPALVSTFSLHFGMLENPGNLLVLAGVILFSTLVAGVYPSIYLSAFQPISILKREATHGRGGAGFRKVLVVFQFAVSIGLIISVMIVFQQMRFIKDANLGFDRDNIILIPSSEEIKNQWEEVKNSLETQAGIISLTLSKRTPGTELLDDPGFVIETEKEVFDHTFTMPHNRVSFDFFKTYGIEIVAGRTFSKDVVSDQNEAFIINETAVKHLGLDNPEDALGLKTQIWGREGKIIGVSKDYNYESLKTGISPIISYLKPDETNTISIKLEGGHLTEKLNFIRNYFNAQFPAFAYSYTFLDDRIAALYENETRMYAVFKYFAGITIIIAVIGLLGLSIFNAESKTKEICIRKVNGASVPGLLILLVRQFSIWIVIAFVIISPVAWFFMNKWLANFAFKINIEWWIFVLTLLVIFLISGLTVLYQTMKAALRNPVEALRYE